MKDVLYEVILKPEHIDAYHAGLLATDRLYKGILAGCATNEPQTLQYMQKNGWTKEVIEQQFYVNTQILHQLEHFVMGVPLPPDTDPQFTLNFREAFEPFEEL